MQTFATEVLLVEAGVAIELRRVVERISVQEVRRGFPLGVKTVSSLLLLFLSHGFDDIRQGVRTCAGESVAGLLLRGGLLALLSEIERRAIPAWLRFDHDRCSLGCRYYLGIFYDAFAAVQAVLVHVGRVFVVREPVNLAHGIVDVAGVEVVLRCIEMRGDVIVDVVDERLSNVGFRIR